MTDAQERSFDFVLISYQARYLEGVKTHKDFDGALSEAKAYLRLAAPFFASLCSSSPITPDEEIPTACVNEAGHIKVNPAFFLSLNVTERGVLLSHEIMHPAWGVFWRSKSLGHDPYLSNVAHDHVINLILEDSYPGWSLPGWLCDKEFTGMSYEEVYGAVEKEEQKNAKQPRNSSSKTRSKTSSKAPGKTGGPPPQASAGEKSIPATGLDVQPDGSGSIDPAKDESAWRDKIVGAFQAARAMGSVPAGIERAVTGLLDPEVDWSDALFLSISEALAHSRVDWAVPSRRADALDIHVPNEESLGYDVSIAVDSSGSVSPANLKRACSEISKIVSTAGGTGRFIVGDAAVHRDIPLRDFDATMIPGGGGTDFTPVFDHLETHPTRLLIFFTDTFGTFPDCEPGYPVVWAVYESAAKSAKVPFGEVIVIPDK